MGRTGIRASGGTRDFALQLQPGLVATGIEFAARDGGRHGAPRFAVCGRKFPADIAMPALFETSSWLAMNPHYTRQMDTESTSIFDWSLVIAVLAFGVSIVTTWFGIVQARHARTENELRLLIEMFEEHRGPHLTKARSFVFKSLASGKYDLTRGLKALPRRKRTLVSDLAQYYDNVGALVAHGAVSMKVVSGYLGGSVILFYPVYKQLVVAERNSRLKLAFHDPNRWLAYFEFLYIRAQEIDPQASRAGLPHWPS